MAFSTYSYHSVHSSLLYWYGNTRKFILLYGYTKM